MSDEEITIWFWLILIFIGMPWAVWHFDLTPFNDEITIYQQINKCYKNNCKWRNNKSITFKVDSNSQSVVFWSSDEPWPIKKAEDCVVVNKKHWNCGTHYKYGFNEGNYSREDTKEQRYISKTMWWFNKL